jgi:hypothetical protein
MDPAEMRELLRRSPFIPFVVKMSNGESYEIRHPEMAMVTPVTLYVFDPNVERVVRCALIQINTAGYLESSDASSSA